jgi:amino acid transporter
MEILLDFGAFLSAFGALLGCVAAAGRLLFAFSRDGFGPGAFAAVRERTGAPVKAIAAAVVFGLLALAILHGPVGVSLSDSYFYFGTVGSLSLLVAYAMTGAGAIRRAFRTRGSRAAAEIVVHGLGIAFVGYILYKSVYPVPESPANLFPYIVAAWLLVGLAIALFSPRLTRRIGVDLATRASLAADPREEELAEVGPSLRDEA